MSRTPRTKRRIRTVLRQAFVGLAKTPRAAADEGGEDDWKEAIGNLRLFLDDDFHYYFPRILNGLLNGDTRRALPNRETWPFFQMLDVLGEPPDLEITKEYFGAADAKSTLATYRAVRRANISSFRPFTSQEAKAICEWIAFVTPLARFKEFSKELKSAKRYWEERIKKAAS